MSCEDCNISLGSNDQANSDGSFKEINVDEVKYTGTVVFGCSGAGDKNYKLQLAKEANSIGGGVNGEEYEMPDPAIGHQIDLDESLTGLYPVDGSGFFQRDFNINVAAFQAQGNNILANPAVTAEIDNFSGYLEGGSLRGRPRVSRR